MKSMRLLSAVFGVFALHTLVVPPANAYEQYYSAIAQYPPDAQYPPYEAADWAYGYALGMQTPDDARDRALAECNSVGLGTCGIREEVHDKSCIRLFKESNVNFPSVYCVGELHGSFREVLGRVYGSHKLHGY